ILVTLRHFVFANQLGVVAGHYDDVITAGPEALLVHHLFADEAAVRRKIFFDKPQPRHFENTAGLLIDGIEIVPAGASLGENLAQQSRRAGAVMIEFQKWITRAKRRQQPSRM